MRFPRSLKLSVLALVALSLLAAGPMRAQAKKAAAPAAAKAEAFDYAAVIKSLKARNIGPANMGGRTVDFAVPESDPTVIYAAVGPSGLWKSEDMGLNWAPSFHKEGTVSVGAVAVSPSHPDIVWVGTGEATARNSVAPGDGVYKSEDAGRTWTNMGLAATRFISRIVIDPADPDVVHVAAQGHLWGPNEERGVYRTTDGGKTWKKVLYVNPETGACDLAIDPSNSKILYAGMWEHRRWPYYFRSGGPGSGDLPDDRRRGHLGRDLRGPARRALRTHRPGRRPLEPERRLRPGRGGERRPLPLRGQGPHLAPGLRQGDLRPGQLPAVLLQPADRRPDQRPGRLRLLRLLLRQPRRRQDLHPGLHGRPSRPPRRLGRPGRPAARHQRQRRRHRHLLGRRQEGPRRRRRALGRGLQRRPRHARPLLHRRRPPGQRQLARPLQHPRAGRHLQLPLGPDRRRRRLLRPVRSRRVVGHVPQPPDGRHRAPQPQDGRIRARPPRGPPGRAALPLQLELADLPLASRPERALLRRQLPVQVDGPGLVLDQGQPGPDDERPGQAQGLGRPDHRQHRGREPLHHPDHRRIAARDRASSGSAPTTARSSSPATAARPGRTSPPTSRASARATTG